MTRGLARTYAAAGISVNAVAPGLVDTPMLRDDLAPAPGSMELLREGSVEEGVQVDVHLSVPVGLVDLADVVTAAEDRRKVSQRNERADWDAQVDVNPLATFFILQGVNAAGTLKRPDRQRSRTSTPRAGSTRPTRSSRAISPTTPSRSKCSGGSASRSSAPGCRKVGVSGNWIYSAGGEPNSARNVGVPVARTKILLFMMTSATAALMGIIEALELRSMQSGEGIGLEFIFIICAVVGGCLLTGGFGSVIGTFFGAAMLGMVQLGIVDAQWDSNWTYTFQGGILFAAVLLNTWIRTRAQRAR